jgi:uncharacterized protein YcfJ
MNLTRKTVFSVVAAAAVTLGGLTLSAEQGGYGQGRARGRVQAGALLGTYELDRTQGDDPARVAANATRNLPSPQRDAVYHNLVLRLQAPATLAIERRGTTVTMSSSSGPQTTFLADGQARREQVAVDQNQGAYGSNRQGANGAYRRQATATTRATFVGQRLTVSSQGNRTTDFNVTFEPLQNGDRMIVTRQLYMTNVPQAVVSRSYYTRVSTQPRWDLYNATTALPAYDPNAHDPRTDPWDPRYDPTYNPRYNPRANPNPNNPNVPNNVGTLVVPEGTRMTAVLDTAIDTRTARAGDRFTMTVQSPNEYRDARIEGVIRSTGAWSNDKPADLRVAFDSIRLRNGQTGSFDAALDSVRKPGGEILRVDGTVQDNRDNNAIQNGAIGAAIGGVIGVLAGGTKGAVIGAVLGGAAGAGGSILANQRDRYLDLPIGTEVTIVTGYRSTGGTR